MQLWTAVIEEEIIVCLHQMFMTDVMVQKYGSLFHLCDERKIF